jgi:hypothetical protein
MTTNEKRPSYDWIKSFTTSSDAACIRLGRKELGNEDRTKQDIAVRMPSGLEQQLLFIHAAFRSKTRWQNNAPHSPRNEEAETSTSV